MGVLTGAVWNDATELAGCERCGARPGEFCQKASGARTKDGEPHAARITALFKAYPAAARECKPDCRHWHFIPAAVKAAIEARSTP